jgi:kynurenine 3-monooxygenase
VTTLISPENLISSFKTNPHLPLISIKCHPYHYSHSAVILGDAAHAMVPFYGQGMNSGLEDVRVFFSILDKYSSTTASDDNITPVANPSLIEYQREQALEEYSATRTVDGVAINDLALQNYIEMRASVISPWYRLRKFLEETLSVYVPSLGWQTKYSRVSFGNERYSEIIKQSERQGKILVRGLVGMVLSPVVITAAVAWWRWRAVRGGTRWFMKWQSLAAWKTT